MPGHAPTVISGVKRPRYTGQLMSGNHSIGSDPVMTCADADCTKLALTRRQRRERGFAVLRLAFTRRFGP